MNQSRSRLAPESGAEIASISADSRRLAAGFHELRQRILLHAYTYKGGRHIADPVTGLIFRPSAETYRIARAIEDQLDAPSLERVLEEVGSEAGETFFAELTQLEGQGFFRKAALDLRAIHKSAVQRFVAHNPRKMMLLVSQTCNLRCVYCYAIDGNFEDRGVKMDLETAQQAIRYLAKRSGRRRSLTVTLFGGEPLVNYGMIKELVPWAQKWCRSIGKRIHFTITTNGTLLDDEVIEFLSRNQFSIMISMDGPAAVQNRNRPNAQGQGSFGKVAERVKRLFELHPHPEIIKVRATMTHQHHDVHELAEFFEKFGFQRIGLGANVGFSFGQGPFDLTPEDRAEVFDATTEIIDEIGIDALRNYKRLPFNPVAGSMVALHDMQNATGPRAKIPCGVGRNDQGVDTDGLVYPCHRYVGMEQYVVGDIWKGIDVKKVEKYYGDVFGAHTHCESCWATHWCTGQCSQYLSHPSGTLYPPDDASCDSIRRSLERNLAIYDQLQSENLDWDRVKREVDN